MKETEKNKKIIIGIVVAALLLSLVIPVSYWSNPITSGRHVSEAVVVDKDTSARTLTLQLYTMSTEKNGAETDTFIQVSGDIPAGCHLGQRVRVGYSKDGLYEDVHQKVELSFFTSGNVMTGWILPRLSPFRAAEDYKIEDIASDGTLLVYKVAA